MLITNHVHLLLTPKKAEAVPRLIIARTEQQRQDAYRALLRAHLDTDAIGDIRLALNQSQPLGNTRFYAKIEKVTGQRREPKPRRRPRIAAPDRAVSAQHRKLEL